MRHLTDDQLDEALTAALRSLDLEEFNRLGDEADRRQADREARLTAPGVLATTAQWYAENSIPVFPILPREKKPFPGSRGFKDATTDVAVVRHWWTRTPDANIGVPTGLLFDVIDIDGPAGYQSLGLLREAGKLPSIIGRVRTPGNNASGRPPGMHCYIEPTGDGNSAGFLPGLDFRGAGGYVLAPPSIGPDGGRYEWLLALRVNA